MIIYCKSTELYIGTSDLITFVITFLSNVLKLSVYICESDVFILFSGLTISITWCLMTIKI